jgi:hypothetical protein
MPRIIDILVYTPSIHLIPVSLITLLLGMEITQVNMVMVSLSGLQTIRLPQITILLKAQGLELLMALE